MTRRSWFCGCIEFSQSSNPAYPGGFWVGSAYCGPVPQAHHHAGNLQFLPGDNVLRFRKTGCQRSSTHRTNNAPRSTVSTLSPTLARCVHLTHVTSMTSCWRSCFPEFLPPYRTVKSWELNSLQNPTACLGEIRGGDDAKVSVPKDWSTNDMNWSGRRDLNSGPPAPKAGALPGCATPRHEVLNRF